MCISMPARIHEIIESKRLVIRPLEEKDFTGFHRFISNDKATKYFFFSQKPASYKDTRRFFRKTMKNYDEPDQVYAYTVAKKSSDEFVGSVGMLPDPDKGA
ncbi:MAG: acetyltransferase (GNAT) family protein [Methanohalophilus sp. T328-1]|nr:MAG: acetyltransferase (GNAT) family protein [Methanohalophilus sp. T328-1]